MRYFFDVAHGAHVVVSHASATYVAVFHSRDSLHQPLTKSVGTAPILVVKSPDDIEKIWPLTAVGAAAGRAMAPIVQGGKRALARGSGLKFNPNIGREMKHGSKLAPLTSNPPISPTGAHNPTTTPFEGKYTPTPITGKDASVGEGMSGQTMSGSMNSTAGAGPSIDSNAQQFADSLPGKVTGPNRVQKPPVMVSESQTNLHGPEAPTDVEMGKTTPLDPRYSTREHSEIRDKEIEEGTKRDKMQERLGLGAMGLMHMSGRAQQKQAELEGEQQRMMQERSTENASTGGGQVAVTA